MSTTAIETTRQKPTPCVRNCCLNESNICQGCGRRLAEILEWHHADSLRQQQICQQAEQRLSQS